MSFTLLAEGSTDFDSTNVAVLDWFVPLPGNVFVPNGSWSNTGQLQLQLRVFFITTTIVPTNIGGTSRFLNPSTSQLGHWAMLIRQFVMRDGRIKYERQVETIDSLEMQLNRVLNDAPLVLRTTTGTTIGHAQSTGPTTICGTARGLTTSPGTPYAEDLDARIGSGGICLAILPGRTEITEVDPLTAPPTLSVDGQQIFLPDALSGVLWGGNRMTVQWEIGYAQLDSSSNYIQTPPLIADRPQFADISYTCDFGQVIPSNGTGCNYNVFLRPGEFGALIYAGDCTGGGG
jgi:hypothetical protein